MTNEWHYTPFTQEEEKGGSRLARALRIPSVAGRLLYRRGIRTEIDAQKFFHPTLEDLHDPFLMRDMDLAVKRLNEALGHKEHILIYGDYDVDGTTAVSLIYKYLRSAGCSEHQLSYYIPGRDDEGYGVSFRGVDYAHEIGATLIIVVDCGIKAINEIAYAKTLGIDFIICDHHHPDEQLPDAVAVLDPKRPDCNYPFEELCGCGVAFKFMQAFGQNNGFPSAPLYKLLDLVVVSIAADLVSVLDENRILAHYGLRQLNRNPSMGLKGIIKTCGLEGRRITMSDIIYKIGPRINASGRMMNGREAVDLLLSNDAQTAARMSDLIDEYNVRRRELDRSTTDEAMQLLQVNPELAHQPIVVLYQPDWHKGVIGIVASRVAEYTNRPTIVLTGTSERIVGSARSVGGIDIYSIIEEARSLLLNFGGHTYAAGMTLLPGKLPAFREYIKEVNVVADGNRAHSAPIEIDAEIELREVTQRLSTTIQRFAPFGPDNYKPTFVTQQLYDGGGSKPVGRNGEHFKVDVVSGIGSTKHCPGIAFNQAKDFRFVKKTAGGHASKPFALVYQVDENHFNGTVSLQLLVKDVKVQQPGENLFADQR